MERAAQAIRRSMRRSATRFMSPNESTTELTLVVQDWKEMKQLYRRLSSCQRSSSEALLRWSTHEENQAIRDVVRKLHELTCVWSEMQLEFSKKFDVCVSQLDLVQEANKRVMQGDKSHHDAVEKEKKIKNKLKKGSPRQKGGDIRLLEESLRRASQARDTAEQTCQNVKAENEIIKMLCFKTSMLKLAEAQLELSEAAKTVFDAFHDVAELIPDVFEERDASAARAIAEMRYGGTTASDQRVRLVLDELAGRQEGGRRRDRVSLPAGGEQRQEQQQPQRVARNARRVTLPAVVAQPREEEAAVSEMYFPPPPAFVPLQPSAPAFDAPPPAYSLVVAS